MPEIELQAEDQNSQVPPTEDNTPQIIFYQPMTDNGSTEAQQESINLDNHVQNSTRSVVYHDANQY